MLCGNAAPNARGGKPWLSVVAVGGHTTRMRFTFSFEILRLGWSGGVLLCHSDKVGRFKDDCGRGVESPKDYYGLCRIFTDDVACIRLYDQRSLQ